MDVWNYILGYRNTLKSVFETWVVHIPFKGLERASGYQSLQSTRSAAERELAITYRDFGNLLF